MAAGHHVHAGPFELARQRRGGTTVPTGKHTVLADQQRDLAAGLAPQGGEFQGDRPRSDDDRAIREGVLLQRLRGIDQRPAERFARQRTRTRAGGQHHVRRVQSQRIPDGFRHLRLGIPQHGPAVGEGGDDDPMRVGERGFAPEYGDATVRHQSGQPFDHRVDGAHPVVAQCAEIESGHLQLQAGGRRPLRRMHRVRGGQ